MPKLWEGTSKAHGNFLAGPGFKKYLANTSWLMLERVCRSVVLLLVGVCIARYLKAEQFGLLSYAASFASLLLPIATLGLDVVVVRELVREPEKKNTLLGTAFVLKLAGAFLLLGVLAVVINLTEDDRFSKFLILIIGSSAVFQSFNVIDFFLQSKVLSKYAACAKMVSLFLWSLLTLVLIWMRAPLLYFALTFLIESVILALGLTVVGVRQNLGISRWGLRLDLATSLLKDSWPLVLSGVAVSIYMKIDQVMIKNMLGSQAVGQYAVAVRVSEACYFIPVIICGSLFPAVLNAKKQSTALYHARLQKLYDLMVWIALPIILVITFSANRIVGLLYGAEFSKAGPVLEIHIWAALFVFMGVASGRHLIAENYSKISFIRTCVGMVLNILLNVLLIPSYQIVGAAFATLISYAAATFSVALFDNTRPIAFMMLKSFLFPCRNLLCPGKNHEKCPDVYLETGKDLSKHSDKSEDTVL
ncbi:MAG: flippase [Planctomycetota bacterium]|jgi:O-antigen/teichoic acid export membrane protein